MKGISPIVATVLLIIIAVAAGVLIWTWLHSMASKSLSETGTVGKEAITVEGIKYSYDATNNQWTLTIYVRNAGKTTVKLMYVYIYDAETDKLVDAIDVSGQNVEIAPGKVGSVQITTTALQDGKTYYVKVTTEEATAFSEVFTVYAS